MRTQSAKDIAFEKERSKFRKEIRELERENKRLMLEIRGLKQEISDREDTIMEKEDWIRRLLEYTELSKEDMEKVIRREKITSEVEDIVKPLEMLVTKFSNYV